MTNPTNELPDDWYLDMAYEDRFECLGDAECDPGHDDWEPWIDHTEY
jgi:hypothetical protein